MFGCTRNSQPYAQLFLRIGLLAQDLLTAVVVGSFIRCSTSAGIAGFREYVSSIDRLSR